MSGPPVAVSELGELVRASLAGDTLAWSRIVERFARLVVAVARQQGVGPSDLPDVSQTVWLRLVEHLPGVREPEALAGWIVTTTRREAQRHVRRSSRTIPMDPQDERGPEPPQPPGQGEADAGLLAAELRAALRAGLAELPERTRELLLLFCADPPLSYGEISRITGMPIGGIGPTRRRSLEKLRGTSAMRQYLAERCTS